jgi:thioesterase domain-containing protein
MENVEDLIPLTPMQRVMLLRSLSTGGHDSLFQQFVFEIRGGLERDAFCAAWRRTVESHSILRTAFLWRGLKQPLQVVRKDAPLPLECVDAAPGGSGKSAVDRTETLRAHLEMDRAAGFDLSHAPLTRVVLFQWGENDWTLVWTSHHLVLDRWSIAPLFEGIWSLYAQLVQGAKDAVAPVGPRYRSYVSWVEQQDASAAEAYWCDRLDGVSESARRMAEAGPSPLGQGKSASQAEADRSNFRLEAASCARLRAAAQASRVTVGAIVQAAWALSMAGMSRAADVCFGLTVSGRPPGVPEVERMVGSFIGNVPVRIRFTAEMTARSLCEHLLREGQSRGKFEYLSPTDLHRISRLPVGEPLFDSLLLWLSPAAGAAPHGLNVTPVQGEAATAWPLTIAVLEEESHWSISAQTAPGLRLRHGYSVADITETLELNLKALTHLLMEAPEAPLADHFRLGEPKGARAPLSVSAPAPRAPSGPLLSSEVELDPGGREFDDPEMMQQVLFDECEALLEASAPLDPRRGFFEQGGSSMLAAQLHARLEALTGRALPLLELFEAPTIGAMAEELVSRPWPLLGGVLRGVREEGARPPLFCVSSPEVNSLGYVGLSRLLSSDQPVYLTQGRPSGTDAIFRMAVSDIPRLAKDSVDAMQERFPDGPYRLFGMCDGALVAFEMARLLEERGAKVDFLCLLNTYALGTLSKRYKFKRASTRIGYYGRRIQEVVSAKLGSAGSEEGGSEEAGHPSPGLAADAAPGADATPSLEDRLAAINGEWFEFDTPRHLPKAPTYRGRITVLRNTAQPYWRIRDEALGWRSYSHDVEVLNLQAQREATQGRERRGQQDAHMALLREPDIQYVARAMTERLDRLESSRAKAGQETELGATR